MCHSVWYNSRWFNLAEYRLTTCSSLSKIKPDHLFLTDLQEKSELFDKAASKFSAKVT